MSAPMSEQRLAEILARANAATEGPWCTDSWEIYQGTEYVPGISFWIGETCRGTADMEQDRADAAFVAAARTDVPELVAEVRRLMEERHSTNEALSDAAEQLRVQRDRIAELPDRLAAVLTEQFTELGNPFSEMRIRFQGPDGWPASKPVGPKGVAEVLRELLSEPTPVVSENCLTCGEGLDDENISDFCSDQCEAKAPALPRQQEDPHDGPLATRYTTPHDLPEVTS
ncbi:hypothetical protein ACFQ9J_28605 [Streptomyces sp. NPDC056529]|uniref:hypothetical protein n=1 Tax=Streptomyces sp. NPDC056529 TaxID=3345855 RepID=UPI0036AA3D90